LKGGYFVKKVLVLVSVLAILAVTFAAFGCQPTPAPTPPKTTAPAPAPTSAAPAPAPAPTVAPAPPAANKFEMMPNPWEPNGQPGGVLRFGILGGPAGFDLYLKPAWAAVFLIPIYNTLVTLNLEYQSPALANIAPDLAEKWTISPDGTVYTFNLVKNAKWHDGTAFTADDVIFSFNKMMDVKAGSRVASSLPANLVVTKVDDYTVKMTLPAASPGFLVNLTSGYMIIQPKSAATADPKVPQFAVGTGPYKFKSYMPNSLWEVEKNKDYFKKDAKGGALPYLDGIQIYILPSATGTTDAYVAKKLDMTNPMQVLYNQQDVDKVEKNAPETKKLSSGGSTGYHQYLNTKFAPFQDANVRKAMALVFSSEDQILARFGSLNFGFPGMGFFNSTWGNPTVEVAKVMGWADATGKMKSYDDRIKEAQALMKASKYPDGFTIRMVYAAVAGNHSESSFTQYGDTLKKYLNIKYELKPYATNAEAYKARDAGDWEMFNEVLYATSPDPDSYIPFFKTGGSSNFMGYSNAKVDALFAQQTTEMDPIKRQVMTREIEKLVLTDIPILPGAFLKGNIYFYPYVHNVGTTQMIYGPENRLEYVWMEVAKQYK
jgi:peptide/nickel transport system substrate-binding protein